ncbi:FMN-linked oxidoreductase [Ramicandelaber brevisporus]|nr:FMN-linked oxidoreductase [Ramicandelaber brevisporus]
MPPRSTDEQLTGEMPSRSAHEQPAGETAGEPQTSTLSGSTHSGTINSIHSSSTFSSSYVAPPRGEPRLPTRANHPYDFRIASLAAPGAAIQPSDIQTAAGHKDVVDGKDKPVPRLFHPLTLRDVTFANRAWIPPMCTYSAQDGIASDWHYVHYGKFAMYGFGLTVVEATGVVPEGRISPFDMGLWNEEQRHALARIVSFAHSLGGKIGIQIGHAGRKASTLYPTVSPTGTYSCATDDAYGWDPVGPTSTPFDTTVHRQPREISLDELRQVRAAFVHSARLADSAGFDVLEIHGAHGYLVSSFLSPTANTRTDEYGGSFENRARLLLEIVRDVRECEAWPATKPLFVRLSATEWADEEGGWRSEDTVRLAPLLYAAGVDLIDVSTGGINPNQNIVFGTVYQVPFSAAIKRGVPGSVVGAVGLITDPRDAENVLQSDEADAVFVGRQALREPSWPLRAARELGAVVEYPPQYGHAARFR